MKQYIYNSGQKNSRPGFGKTSSTILSTLWFVTLMSCGLPQTGPYYPDKTYGRTKRAEISGQEINAPTPNTDDAQKSPTPDSSGPPPQGPSDPIPSDPPGEGEPTNPPPSQEGDSQQGGGNTPPPESNPPPPPAPESPPPFDKILQKSEFQVIYDAASVKGLRNSVQGPITLNEAIANNVRARLVPGPEDGLTITQNHGDGKGKFQVFYSLRNSVADANRAPASPSISALRTINALPSEICKSGAFVCSDRILLAPLKGQLETMCFLDPATGMPMAYPIAPKADIKLEDLNSSLGTLGPYHVRIYQGDISCAPSAGDLNKGPYFTETVSAKISLANLEGFKYHLQTQNPIAPSFGVIIENLRQTGNSVAPYLDETARLHGKTTYFFNVEQKLLVKKIVQSRLSLDVARSLGGGLFAGFIDQLVNLDGIMVDLHYEFCKNLLDPQAINHCSKAP